MTQLILRDQTPAQTKAALDAALTDATWPLWVVFDDAVEVYDTTNFGRQCRERGSWMASEGHLAHNRPALEALLRDGWPGIL